MSDDGGPGRHPGPFRVHASKANRQRVARRHTIEYNSPTQPPLHAPLQSMRVVYLLSFLVGLAFGVVSMLAGIDRQRRRRQRTPILNYPTVGAFFTLTGAIGYLLSRYSSLSPAVTALIALLVGLAAGGGMLGLVAGWAIPSAARDVEDERYRLQGFLGRVTRAIGAADSSAAAEAPDTTPLGEISFVHDGIHSVSPARSLDGQRIELGTDVVIERIEDGIAYVESWSRIEKELRL